VNQKTHSLHDNKILEKLQVKKQKLAKTNAKISIFLTILSENPTNKTFI